jgi:hypothetical protein
MPIIFQFYLLFIPLKRLVERYSSAVIGIATLILYYIYTSGLPFADTNTVLGTLNAWLPLKADFPLSDRLFMSYLPFYMFGLLLGLHAVKVKHVLQNHAIIVTLFYLVTTFFHVSNRVAYYVYQSNFPVVLPYAWELSAFGAIFMLLLLTQYFEPFYRKHTAIPQLSSYTFDLYLAHPLILQFGEIALRKVGMQSTSLILVILLIAGITLPLIFAHIKNKIKIAL